MKRFLKVKDRLLLGVVLTVAMLCLSGCIGASMAKKKARTAFTHFNNRDMTNFLSLWDEDASFTYPGEVSASGTAQGKEAIQKWFNNLMDKGPSVNFKLKSVCVENIYAMSGTNVLAVEWENSVTSRKGDKILVNGVTMIRIEKGKVVHARDYILETEKLPLAWGE